MKRATMAAVAIALAAHPGVAAENDVYQCKVADFVNLEPHARAQDNEFVDKNMRKTFSLFEQRDRVAVQMMSPDFEPSTTEYEITEDGPTGLLATARSEISHETLSIERVQIDLERRGIWSASITVHNYDYANVWFLDCTKAP